LASSDFFLNSENVVSDEEIPALELEISHLGYAQGMTAKLLFIPILIVVLTACFTQYIDVDLNADPKVLRGAYSGSLEYDCLRSVDIAAWKPDGSGVLVAELGAYPAGDSTLSLWTPGTAAKTREFKINGRVESVVWHGTLNQFTLVYDRNKVERFDAGTGDRLEQFLLPQSAGSVWEISPDGRTVLSQLSEYQPNKEGVLQAWDISTGTQIWTKNLGFILDSGSSYPKQLIDGGLMFNADGSKLAFLRPGNTFSNGDALTLNPSTGAVLTTSPGIMGFEGFAWRGADLLVAQSGTSPSTVVSRFSGTDGAKLGEVTLEKPSSSLSFSPDGRFGFSSYVSSNATGRSITGRIWNLETGAVVRDIELERRVLIFPNGGSGGGTGAVYGFSPDNKTLLLAGTRETCGLNAVNLETGNISLSVPLDTPSNRDVGFTFQANYKDDSTYTVTGSGSGALEGYSINGTGYGGDCTQAPGGALVCERYVKPQTSPGFPSNGRASLTLTKSPAPALNLEIVTLLPPDLVGSPDNTKYGQLEQDKKVYWLTIKPVAK
jgi:hypothetical protein